MSIENVFYKWVLDPLTSKMTSHLKTKKDLASKPKYWLQQQPNRPHHVDRHNTIQRDRIPKDPHREKTDQKPNHLASKEGQPKGPLQKKTSAPYVQGQSTPNLIWSQALADPDKKLHKPKSTPPWPVAHHHQTTPQNSFLLQGVKDVLMLSNVRANARKNSLS